MHSTDIDITNELKNEASKIRAGARLHWSHWFAIFCSACITIYAYSVTKQQDDRRALKIFAEQSENIVHLVAERMEKYEMALYSAKSAIKANNDQTDYEHWKRYSNDFHIDNRYPGINGIGVIYNIQESALSDYLKNQRITRPEYNIHPPHQEKEYWPITYIEPEEINLKAIGLDMAHEANRHDAVKKARDTGKPQVTAPIILVQDNEKTPGFLFYVPFYKGSISHDTVEKRRANILGAVYAPFIFKNLIAGTLSKDSRGIKIIISDDNSILYSEALATESEPTYNTKKDVNVYGRTWTFEIFSDHTFDELYKSKKPIYVLLIGALVEALIITVFILLARANKKAVNFAMRLSEGYKEKAISLQIANDELEEFAYRTSHDLRAPVISSRQLIQMVMQMVDKSLVPQKVPTSLNMVDGALEKLESLIDEILNLTKITNLQEDHVTLDIKDIVLQSIDSASVIEGFENLDIVVDIPDNAKIVNQALCFKTVTDNLLSNAVKYQDKTTKSPFLHISYEEIGSNCKLMFEDNGIGVPEQQKDKLFNMFMRLHPRTSFGSGLGLYIVKKSILKMGGKIEYKATDEGSLFTIVLKR